MSSRAIDQIKQVLNSPQGQELPEETLGTPDLDFSPMQSVDEQKDFDTLSNDGELLLESLCKEIVKPQGVIEYYNIFKAEEGKPIRINSYTMKTLFNWIEMLRYKEFEHYSYVIPHLYKLIMVLPSLFTVELDHSINPPVLDDKTTIPFLINSTTPTSPIQSIPTKRKRSNSSDSTLAQDNKYVHTSYQDIPKGFFDSKTKELEGYMNDLMSTIPKYEILDTIGESLDLIRENSCGQGIIIRPGETHECEIENIVKMQIIDPIVEIFRLVLKYAHSDDSNPARTRPMLTSKGRSHFETSTASENNDLSKGFDNQHGFQRYIAISEYGAAHNEVTDKSKVPANTSRRAQNHCEKASFVTEIKKPSLSETSSCMDLTSDGKFSDLIRQSLMFSCRLNLDTSSISDGISFWFFITDDENEPMGNSEDVACKKVFTNLTFNGVEKSTNSPLFQNNKLPTRLLVSLVLYMVEISKEIADQDSPDAKEKSQRMNRISKSSEERVNQTSREENFQTRLAGTSDGNSTMNQSDSDHTNKYSTEPSNQGDKDMPSSTPYCSVKDRHESPITNSTETTAMHSDNPKFTARVPSNFKEYKVIQNDEDGLCQVIRISRETFNSIFSEHSSDSANQKLEVDVDDDNRSDNVILKLYSFDHLLNYYFQNFVLLTLEYQTPDEFIDWVVKTKYEVEVEVNQNIQSHNDEQIRDQNLDKVIKCPKMCGFGAMVASEANPAFNGYFIGFEEIINFDEHDMFSIEDLEVLTAEVEKLHRINIVHGDIRLPNILFDEQNKLNLIDFNSAVLVKESPPPVDAGVDERHDVKYKAYEKDYKKLAALKEKMLVRS
ncbi:hypothetical protein WICANDRAFT_80892 [Wickerhamomyces anomalus NRRL Y-366-8]|uniref:Protein kinase domain-containing protein n=1 Tax=Wickerhamomyces anomalus (strain ATCC 58044 / CBS 1984 / NCYC 433 / NRRL Y-366-8) TaxID=683960 RepID=A0A1E3NWN8_WICAA|nr:uncharacterized protein WICANDRAFT_80892 [Wickerhamomyces anomalus NRRL Y-366-8]ODQ57558.1 hypothetical protein WICANDRAFT_80892 [Wickerhamomyces anomalus NRRL Y-366-8]